MDTGFRPGVDAPVVFLFPGQSSRSHEMFSVARRIAPEIAAGILVRSSDVLGRDMERISFDTNLEVQLGVFVANHIHAAALQAEGVRPALSLGLSLGEYNHLVQIGALSFEDALELIDRRGRAYDEGPSGAMAAIFPLTLPELEPLVCRAGEAGALAVSNVNAPTQHVVGGEREAVDALMALVEEETFATAVVIEERIPMHTPRFRPVAGSFREALERAPWQPVTGPYLPNVTGEILRDPSDRQIVEMLVRHVSQPVLWRRSIESVLAAHPDAVFIEVGPGRVLAGLMRRPWIEAPCRTTHDRQAFAATVDSLRMVSVHGG